MKSFAFKALCRLKRKTFFLRLKLRLVLLIFCDVSETPTLREKGAKESFENFNNSRDTNVNIPVDEDHEDPDSRDCSISMNLT